MRCWLLVLVGACKFEPTLVSPDDASSTPDMRVIDTPPDQFDDRCFAGGDFYFCLGGSPDSASRTLVGTFDTGDCTEHGASIEMIAGVSTCLVDGDTITIPGAFVVSGSRPLALAALQQITITDVGRLDISGTNLPGPGSNLAGTCTVASGLGGGGGGGGGAGGSLGSRGGNGGDGNGGAGGLAQDPASPVSTLRGGCPGGLGGSGGGGIAAGGNGGGAVLLAARTRIAVDGVIDASGSGGVGGTTPKGGGGGGGSGGLVVFHTATLAVSATAHVAANGGGGGGGAGQGTSGQPGLDPDPLLHTSAAPGGSSTTGGNSDGGDGATLLVAAQPGQSSNGGGGGGGGTGVIRVLAGGAIPAPAASPTPTN